MHDQPLPVVVALLCSDTNTGLPRQTAEERLAHHGRIVLRAAKTTPWWIRLHDQTFAMDCIGIETPISAVSRDGQKAGGAQRATSGAFRKRTRAL